MEGKVLSHFRILGMLGEGGMGIVYRAEDLNLHRQVALKLLRPGFVESEERRARFKREARTAAAVSHPNIATIHEIDDADGMTFIAMELVEGESLRHRLAHGPLPISEAVRVAADVASALTKAHEAGVIHRDLKPDNVMITPDGHVKILDFGLAKLLDPATASTDQELADMETIAQNLTREGRVFGTAAYMSPEQARGQVVDSRSDIFSFGAMLYEMLTGRVPFKGETISDTISAVLRDPAVPALELNPQVPLELDRILARCLQKKADERFQSSRDLMLDLRQVARTTDVLGATAELTPPSGHHVGYGSQTFASSVSSYGSGSHPPGVATPSGPMAVTPGGPVDRPSSSRWRTALIAALTVVVIIVIGVIGSVVRPLIADRAEHPVAPDPEPGALAVHALENLKDPSDPERLGQILQELIITDLSSVEPLRVYSSQRLYDIQKLLTGRDDRVYDRETATEVAQYAGAELMLTGTISKLGERWIVLSQLVDVASGTIRASERIDGTDLYAMVDQLTDRIRGRLDLAVAARSRAPEKSVKEMTTTSLEAYQHYLHGMDLLNDQKFEEAVAVLDSAIAIDPAFSKAYYAVAVAHWWAADGSEAARAPLEKLLSGDLEISEKERRMAEGALLLVDKKYDEALPVFERLAAAYPDEKDVWYMLGECHYHGSRSDRTQALRAFTRSVKLDPQFFLGYRHIFDIYDQNAMTDESVALARVIVDLDPDNQDSYARWVRYTAATGDEAALDAAIDEATRKFPHGPGRQELMIGVGYGHLRAGRLALSRAAFQEALGSKIADVRTRAEIGLARVELSTREFDAAEDRLTGLLSRVEGADALDVTQRLAEVYLTTGRFPEGLTLMDRFAELDIGADRLEFARAAFRALGPDPMSEAALAKIQRTMSTEMAAEMSQLLATVGEWCGDVEGAARHLEALDSLRQEPRPDDYVLLGSNAFDRGDLTGAEVWFNRGLVASPSTVGNLLGLAAVSARRGDLASAVAQASRAVTLEPRDAAVREAHVRMLIESGTLGEAEAAIEAARKQLDPELFAAMLLGSSGRAPRGVIVALARAGEVERARALLAEATALEPQSGDVLYTEGWLALDAGDTAAALRMFRRAQDGAHVPSFESARLGMSVAAALLMSGDTAGAERELRTEMSRGPRRVASLRLMAYVLDAAGRSDEAVTFAERASSMDPGVESVAALAWVLVAGGIDVPRGEQLARDADAEAEADSWELPFVLPYVAPLDHTLGLAALRQGRLAEAVATLEAAAEAHPDREALRRDLDEARAALRDAQG